MPVMIREAAPGDLSAILALCACLHDEPAPPPDRAAAAWRDILTDHRQHVLIAEIDGIPAATCVLAVIPNLTRSARPYALIENVVTHPEFRGRGCATALLRHASGLAGRAGCYKVMLLTGHKDAATQNVYRGAGFNSEDKTAFIRWL